MLVYKLRWLINCSRLLAEYYEGVKLDMKNQEMAKAFMKAVQNAKAATE